MPIFEYKCEKCSAMFEEFIRNPADEKKTCCPTCGGRRLTKQFSTFGMSSKGDDSASGSSCSGCTITSCPHSRDDISLT